MSAWFVILGIIGLIGAIINAATFGRQYEKLSDNVQGIFAILLMGWIFVIIIAIGMLIYYLDTIQPILIYYYTSHQ